MLFTELTRSGVASRTAISAARFMLATSSSAALPIPTIRRVLSTRWIESGSGIFTLALSRKPSGSESCDTALPELWISASLSPCTASWLLMSASVRPSARPLMTSQAKTPTIASPVRIRSPPEDDSTARSRPHRRLGRGHISFDDLRGVCQFQGGAGRELQHNRWQAAQHHGPARKGRAGELLGDLLRDVRERDAQARRGLPEAPGAWV